MPNHVANYVIIEGDTSVLKDFWSKATHKSSGEETLFRYDNLHPAPPSADWYDWNCQNWGNKWGCYNVSISVLDYDNKMIALFYDTAWSTSTPFWIKVTSEFDIMVKNYYHDEGSNFCGKSFYSNGNVMNNKEYSDYVPEKTKFLKYATLCGRNGYYDDDDSEEMAQTPL
jgi:hypothetical protein